MTLVVEHATAVEVMELMGQAGLLSTEGILRTKSYGKKRRAAVVGVIGILQANLGQHDSHQLNLRYSDGSNRTFHEPITIMADEKSVTIMTVPNIVTTYSRG